MNIQKILYAVDPRVTVDADSSNKKKPDRRPAVFDMCPFCKGKCYLNKQQADNDSFVNGYEVGSKPPVA